MSVNESRTSRTTSRSDAAKVVLWCVLVAAGAFGATRFLQTVYDRWLVSSLVQQLGAPQQSERAAALRELKIKRVDVLPHLLELLKSPNVEVRRFAAGELNQRLPTPPVVIDAFLRIAVDSREDERVRSWAIYTLGRVGQLSDERPDRTSRVIVEALCQVLREQNVAVSPSAAHALGEFRQVADGAIACLLTALSADAEIIQVSAAGAIVKIDPERDQVILPILLRILESDDELSRDWAIAVLGELGPMAQSAAPTLKALIAAAPNSTTAYHSEEALKRITAPSTSSEP